MLGSVCLPQLSLLVCRLVDLGNSRILQNLLCRSFECLPLFRLVFEQERQFFQRLAKRLREEEVDEDDLEAEPAHVHQQILPADVLQTDWVDKAA